MRSRLVTCLSALMVIAVLALPGRAAAQQHGNGQYPYILVDLGTFGGPQSTVFGYQQILGRNGAAVGVADTSAPDPYYPNGNGFLEPYARPDPYVQHAFVWHKGQRLDLGTLPGPNNSSTADWINARGDMAGASTNGISDTLLGTPEAHGVVWIGGQIHDLGTLGGNESVAFAINDREQVAGSAANAIPDPYSLNGWGTQTRAFLWQGGVMHDLGTLGGPDAFAGGMLNERGQVAGNSYTNATPNATTGVPTMDPFLWQDGHMQDLGTLGGTYGIPNGLNSRGEVAGQSNLAGDLTYHPFLWDGHALRDMGTLGGDDGLANWINEAGDVVGRADLPGSQTHHAVLWTHGVMTDLGVVAGDDCDTAWSVNAADQVVGDSGICGVGPLHAFLWEQGTIYDLNTLVAPSSLQLIYAYDINDQGEIAGYGMLPDGNQHAVLLVPREEADREGLMSNAPAPGTARPVNMMPARPALCALAPVRRGGLAHLHNRPCLGA